MAKTAGLSKLGPENLHPPKGVCECKVPLRDGSSCVKCGHEIPWWVRRRDGDGD